MRGAAGAGGDAMLRRRVTGLLNRMSDSNMAAIASEVLDLFPRHGRRPVTDCIVAELLQVQLLFHD